MNHALKKSFYIAGICFAVLVFLVVFETISEAPVAQNSFSTLPGSPKSQISVGRSFFVAEIADTPEKRKQGLSGKESLPPNHAMLFVFPAEGVYGIWMKDMNFPIDILWLDPDKKVISIKENVSPETYPEVFYPEKGALYVIEVNAGKVDEALVGVGDEVRFSLD